MRPVKPLDANMVYRRPNGRDDIGDLECTRVAPGHIRTQWRLNAEEIAFVLAGGDIVLEILTEPIPPVALNLTEPFCPECIVEMTMERRGAEERDDVKLPEHWQFRCPTCRRWR